MARKILNVKPVSEIELQFQDGNSILLRFDVKALLNFNEFEDGMTGFIKETSLPIMCAKLIYIGAKTNDDTFTYNRALEITSELDPASILEIINEFNESMGNTKNEVQAEQQKKLMESYLQKMLK